MRRTILGILLALLLVSAGCLAGGGDDGVSTSGTDGSDGAAADADDDPANDTAVDEDGAPAGPTWNVTWANGTLDGVDTGIVRTDWAYHHRNTTADDLNLTVNVTTEGEDLNIWITPPDCEPGFFNDCDHYVPTEDGEAHWSTEDPAEGAWEIEVDGMTGHTGATDYVIRLAVLQPAEA